MRTTNCHSGRGHGRQRSWPRPASAYMVYVSNEKDNTITVVDSTTMEVVKTVQVGQRPRGITISHDGKFIYLCASDDDTIEVIDTATLEIVGTLPSGPDPELFVLSPDGKTLYVANEDDNLVTVIDLDSKKVLAEIPVGVEPEGMGISPDGKTHGQHVGNDEHGPFHRHRRPTRSPTTCWWIRGRASPSSSRTAREVWVSAEIGGTVSVIDNATREVTHKITFAIPGLRSEAIQPVGVRITADGKKAYVALGPANRVAVINTQDLRGGEIRSGRPARLAARLHARPEDDHQHQRHFQRHHLHRRGDRRAGQVGHRRRAAMGRGRVAELRAFGNSKERTIDEEIPQ